MEAKLLRCVRFALLAGTIAFSGCTKQVRSSVPSFAQAAQLTSTDVQAAFLQVQSIYADTQIMNYAVTYDGNFDPSAIPTTWLPQSEMDVRMKVLQGLSQYASELNSLTGTNDITSLNAASTGVGKSLQSLTASSEFKSMAAIHSMPANFPNQASTAVNALGNWLIEAKLHKALPAEIEKMDPNIQSICQLLIADIGTVDTNPGHPPKGNGLRQVLWIQYSAQIVAWNQYVTHNMKELSPDTKLAAIEKLPQIAQQQRQSDQTLQQAQVVVAQLGKAHTELVKAARTKQNLSADVGDLLAEAQRLNTYYQGLSSAK